MSEPVEPSPHPAGWSSDYFRDPAQPRGNPRFNRGLIGHVPLVAALLIVQGSLEVMFALFTFAFALVVHYGPERELGSLRGLAIVIAVAGGISLATGLLRLVAGLFNLRYRRRGLGMVALGAGLLTMMTGYCAPTAIALAVYGLIVYVNESVVAAFAMGDSGRTSAQIRDAFMPKI